MVVISLLGCASSVNISKSEGYVEDETPAANRRLAENERYGGSASTEGLSELYRDLASEARSDNGAEDIISHDNASRN